MDAGTRLQRGTAWLVAALLYMGVIFGLSSVPGDIGPEAPDVYLVFLWLSPDLQNLLHIPLFGGLAWLWCRALDARGLTAGKAAWLALTISLLYGVVDEFHQAFVPGRSANGVDLFLDALGAVAGVAAYVHLRRRGWLRQGRSTL